MIIAPGKTSVSVYVYFVDDVDGTKTGEPTTGLLFSDIETGGSASYVRQGAFRADFTLKTLSSANAAYDEGGFILVDDSNMPGLYRVDIPDAALVSGVDQMVIHLVAATGKNTLMRPVIVDLRGDPLLTQMTESYAADGVAPTLSQAIFAIMQQAGEFEIIGTTVTVKKLDGTNVAMTFTLDDPNDPTSRTRAT